MNVFFYLQVELDFAELYPTATLAFYMKWDLFFITILSLKKDKITDATAKNYMQLLEKTENAGKLKLSNSD